MNRFRLIRKSISFLTTKYNFYYRKNFDRNRYTNKDSEFIKIDSIRLSI